LKAAADRPSYPLFDWLRFTLASVVALSHADVITWGQAGNLAVQVFFALSGWLIGGILLSTRATELPRFFFNRATRIWVPYAFAIALLYGLSTLRDPVTGRWLEFLFYDVTFTHNWFSLRPNAAQALAEMPLRGTPNHFWSICVEEQYYLVAPLLMLLPVGKRSIFWLAAAVLLGFVSTVFLSVALGVLAACLHREWGDWHLNKWAQAGLMAVGALAATAITYQMSYDLAAPVFSVAVVLLAALPGARGGLGEFLGGISYPMYLNHWMGAFGAHALGKWFGLSVLLQGGLAYAGGIVAGAAAYLAVDRIVMANRNAYYSPKRGIALAVIGYVLVATGVVLGTTIFAKGPAPG
jgi:peptidoglycan/LPS O-acetylase OafA/YrhL